MPGIDDFRHMAITGAERVVAAGDGGLDDASATVNWSGRAVRFFTGLFDSAAGRADTQRLVDENRTTVTEFNAALRREYGAPIATALQRRPDGHELSALEIRQTLRQADAMHTAQRRDAMNERRALAHMDRVADLGAQVRRRPDDFTLRAAGETADVRAARMIREADQDRTLGESMQVAMDHVMSRVRMPEGPQSRLLAHLVRQNLEAMFAEVYALDRTPDKHLLAELGTTLAGRLNDDLLRGLAVWLENHGREDASLAESVAEIERHGGLQALYLEVPALEGHLRAEARGFTGGVKLALARVERDLADLGARFGGGAPRGLTSLHVTDSDPHKGGQQVCILGLDTGRQVVYKPRDVRIDEAIAGRNLQSGRPSLMEATAGRLPPDDNAMPVYTFLPRGDDEDGHYGYVQHLSHGSTVDNVVTPERARDHYREMGRAAAVAALAGCSDLHHENIMVSGGRPYFTDLEFAFGRIELGLMEQALGGGDAAYRAPAEGGGADAEAGARRAAKGRADEAAGRLLGATQLEMALTHAVDTDPPGAPWRVAGDRLVAHHVPPKDVTESLLVVRDGGAVRNNREAPIFKERRGDFAEGFTQVLRALRGHPGDLRDFVAASDRHQVRHHPIGTAAHRVHFGHLKESMGSQDGGVGDVRGGVGADLRAKARAGHEDAPRLLEPMLSAYAAHDIPYFSREVGSRDILRDGHEPIGEGYFSDTSVGLAGRVGAALAAASDERLDAIGTAVSESINRMQLRQDGNVGAVHREMVTRITR